MSVEIFLGAAKFLEVLANLRSAHQAYRDTAGALRSMHSGKDSGRPTGGTFGFVRQHQRTQRRQFAELALELRGNESGRGLFQYAPLLCHDSWVPPSPIQLGVPTETLQDDTRQFETKFVRSRFVTNKNNVRLSDEFQRTSQGLLPLSSSTGEPHHSLSDAIREIEHPNERLFVSRPGYSLIRVAGTPVNRLDFTASTYFDYIDCGELLAFELILEALKLSEEASAVASDSVVATLEDRLHLRSLAGEWNAVSFRPSLAGVNTLTVFADPRDGSYSFPMLSRAQGLGSAASTLHVVPAGEFQPTTDSPLAWSRHCTLWQTVLREFAEELLLVSEARSYGLDMQALAKKETIAPLLELIRGRDWKTYFLGVALDPLTLKPEILMVSVINLMRFREAVGPLLPGGRLPAKNSEGAVLSGPDGFGERLSREALIEYREDDRMLPAGCGCIEMLLRFSMELTPGLE